MEPSALFLLISASFWSLGLTLPVPTNTPDSRDDADRTTLKDWTIADKIVQANKDVPFTLAEGDIMRPSSRSAVTCKACQWGKSQQGVVVVPYVIASNFSDNNKNLITTTMLEFEAMTCVTFQERDEESNYLNFQSGQGCWSYIGKTKGGQTVNLQQNSCMNYGLIQHEIMHSLGFFHEHTRIDRDNYVDINWQFISPANIGDFKKDNGNTANIPYDYKSVMHYGSRTFVNTSGERTIITKPDPNTTIGQRTGLSSLDVRKINVLYNCNICRTKFLGASGNFSSRDATPVNSNDNCLWLLHVPSSLVLLQFDQFVCPFRKCNATINVYDGVNNNSSLIATVMADQPLPPLISSNRFMLLEYITDSSTPSSFDASYSTVVYGGTFTINGGSLTSPNFPFFYPNNAKGTYVLIAPPKSQVSLTFSNIDIEPSPNCTNDYIDIRDGGDPNAPSLGVYCGRRSSLVVTSSGPILVIQFSSNSVTNRRGYTANYSFDRVTSIVHRNTFSQWRRKKEMVGPCRQLVYSCFIGDTQLITEVQQQKKDRASRHFTAACTVVYTMKRNGCSNKVSYR